MYQNEYVYKVKWADTDAAAIVYYPNFYKWMDQATAELFHSLGYPLSQLFEQNAGMPLVETHCEFKAPALFEDVLRIESKIVHVGEKSFKVTHDIYKQELLLAAGYEVRVWVSINQGNIKAASIPARIRKAMIG